MKTSYIIERRSIPIVIQKTESEKKFQENLYSFKNNSWNPDIQSPPNDFMLKLLDRINNYYDCKVVCNSQKK